MTDERNAAPAPKRLRDMTEADFCEAQGIDAPVAAPAVDEIMALADAWKPYAVGATERYAALRAAVEQLVRERDDAVRHAHENNDWASLRRRCERAEQDAARYRWLRGGKDVPTHSVRWGRWEINHWEGANGWRNLLCSELDTAIDAAMKEGK